MGKRFLIFFLLVNLSLFVRAQKDFEYIDTTLIPANKTIDNLPGGDTAERTIITDTSVTIRPLIFQADTMNKWKNKTEYSYSKNLDSLLREKQRIAQRIIHGSRINSPNFFVSLLQSGLLQMIMWVIAIAVVVYILYQLFISKGAFSRSRKKQPVAETTTEDAMFLQQDFDGLISQSYKLGNYRAAIRYLFLKTLKQLSDKNLIIFAIDKTNTNYLRELPFDKHDSFSNLVLHYEYVWYGNFEVKQSQFSAIESKFSSFLKTL